MIKAPFVKDGSIIDKNGFIIDKDGFIIEGEAGNVHEGIKRNFKYLLVFPDVWAIIEHM